MGGGGWKRGQERSRHACVYFDRNIGDPASEFGYSDGLDSDLGEVLGLDTGLTKHVAALSTLYSKYRIVRVLLFQVVDNSRFFLLQVYSNPTLIYISTILHLHNSRAKAIFYISFPFNHQPDLQHLHRQSPKTTTNLSKSSNTPLKPPP